MFFQRMEQLLLFIETLGYIAVALMLLQIFLTVGVLSCQKSSNDSSNGSSNDSSNDSSHVRESFV